PAPSSWRRGSAAGAPTPRRCSCSRPRPPPWGCAPGWCPCPDTPRPPRRRRMPDTLSPSAAALSPADVAAYHEDGYLVLRGLLPAGVVTAAAAGAEGLLGRAALISVRNLRCRWQDNVFTGECTFETFDPVTDLSPACARLAAEPRLLAALAALYGGEACLFKDKLIFKPPGIKGYGLHQDWIAWPGFPRSFLTVVAPLDPAG